MQQFKWRLLRHLSSNLSFAPHVYLTVSSSYFWIGIISVCNFFNEISGSWIPELEKFTPYYILKEKRRNWSWGNGVCARNADGLCKRWRVCVVSKWFSRVHHSHVYHLFSWVLRVFTSLLDIFRTFTVKTRFMIPLLLKLTVFLLPPVVILCLSLTSILPLAGHVCKYIVMLWFRVVVIWMELK